MARQNRFLNLWDAGISPDLVSEVAARIDAAAARGEKGARFVTVRRDLSAPMTVGEQRLVLTGKATKGADGKKLDPLGVVRRLRVAAEEIGASAFYVPRVARSGITVGAEDAQWLRSRGHTAQAIGDLFGVSKNAARDATLSAVPAVGDRAARARWEAASEAMTRRNTAARVDETDFRAGAEWLQGRRLAGEPIGSPLKTIEEIVELFGPARVARVGAALRDLREAKRPEPPVL